MGKRRSRKRNPAAHAHRKALQLCRQVERTLGYVLADSADDVLRSLVVQSVEPAPNAGRLLVGVSSPDAISTAALLARLHAASGWLRSEMARDVHRKKLPELTFRLLAHADTGPSAANPQPMAPA